MPRTCFWEHLGPQWWPQGPLATPFGRLRRRRKSKHFLVVFKTPPKRLRNRPKAKKGAKGPGVESPYPLTLPFIKALANARLKGTGSGS